MIELAPYQPCWPALFEEEKQNIAKILGSNCIHIHHVGSTSVPGMWAKPKIDMIAEVYTTEGVIPVLESAGYPYKGEWNIPFKRGFTKRIPHKINVHVLPKGHVEITTNLLFRDYLRTHESVQEAYSNLKKKIAKDPFASRKDHGILPNYTLEKHDFIEDILEKAGFNGTRFFFCTHYSEWNAYHRICKEGIFDPLGVIYDPHHPTMMDSSHRHFVLCSAKNVVSVGKIEITSKGYAVLRLLATDPSKRGKGFGTLILQKIEAWLKKQGISSVKVHANPGAERFYRRFGYQDIDFDDDPSIYPNPINLGKDLQ